MVASTLVAKVANLDPALNPRSLKPNHKAPNPKARPNPPFLATSPGLRRRMSPSASRGRCLTGELKRTVVRAVLGFKLVGVWGLRVYGFGV